MMRLAMCGHERSSSPAFSHNEKVHDVGVEFHVLVHVLRSFFFLYVYPPQLKMIQAKVWTNRYLIWNVYEYEI